MGLMSKRLTVPQIRLNRNTILLAILFGLLLLMSGIFGNPFVLISAGFLVLLFPVSVVIRKFSAAELTIQIPDQAKMAIAGVGSALLIASFIWSIKTLIFIEFISLIDILSLKAKGLLALVALIISVQGLHLLSYYLHKNVVAHETKENKFFFYASSLLFILIVAGFNPRVLFVLTVTYIIYSLLLDLFIETKRANLIWLILWTIILGAFLTMAIVHGTNAFIVKQVPILNAFTIFSLIFIFKMLLYGVYALFNRNNYLLPSEWSFNLSSTLLLRNRIQLSILVTIVFSFIAISAISIFYYIENTAAGTSYDLHSDFSQALLNTSIFLFLIGFSISFSLSQYIRNPLIEMGRTLKDVKLNKENKKIEWKGKDEIGMLINEYNKMIEALEDNATMLAQVERDNAWREMAKQVAHEIKNPLTPMKLSLQHLQRSIHHKRGNTEELSLRMCDTLMNQVDNLQQIADEFSNFGSLPQSDNQKILLNDVVERIHDLFRNRQDMDIHLIEPIDDIGVYADKNQLIRVLNNIVKNSIQAIPEDKKGYIELKLWKESNKAIITVKDNGIGISEDQKEMIFKPRFTTKSSGSGLGLAIAANMIDSMGGTIRFESEHHLGTTFFIELPLIRTTFSKKDNRVFIDD